MAVITSSVATLSCDGCGHLFSDGKVFDTSHTARGEAYAQGWRFVPKITQSGGPSGRSPHDVCPECLPTFEPKLDQPGRRKGRA